MMQINITYEIYKIVWKNETTVYSLIGYSNDKEKILMSQKEFDLFNMTNFIIR